MATLKEYDKLYLNKENKDLFESIESFVKTNIEIDQFLKLGRDKNGDFLQAQNYVGIIQTKSGDVLEILPKIHSDYQNSDNSIRESKSILLKMLKTLTKHPFKNIDIANLTRANLSLLEIFISMFLDELSILIRKGIKSEYIECEENLKYLKGKLNIAYQQQFNSIHKERFYVSFQEFCSDRIENRIIKSTLLFLQKLSKSSNNQRHIQEYLFVFDQISTSKIPYQDFKKVRLDRQMKHYEQIMLWCEIFLQENSFSPYKGNSIAFALLFDMNKVFESYVGYVIREKGLNVYLQHSKHHLLKEYSSGNLRFKLRPDIYIEDKNIIADTKWKKITSENDFSQADFYQLFAYGNKYKCQNMYLIYPYYSDFPQKSFNYNTGNTSDLMLNVIFFNIKTNEFSMEI